MSDTTRPAAPLTAATIAALAAEADAAPPVMRWQTTPAAFARLQRLMRRLGRKPFYPRRRTRSMKGK